MSEEQRCPRCVARGKDWSGDDPKCAFISGVFNTDNWNCATMSALRDLAEPYRVYSEDESVGVIPFDGEFVILSWYKNRGRTQIAIEICGHLDSPLRLSYAEEVLGSLTETPPQVEREEI